MRFFCIADEDTVRGFRLAGVAGQAVATPEEAARAIAEAFEKSECGIVIVTQQVAAGIRQIVDAFRLERDQPLIVEIPGPAGALKAHRGLREMAQEAIGIRIDQEAM